MFDRRGGYRSGWTEVQKAPKSPSSNTREAPSPQLSRDGRNGRPGSPCPQATSGGPNPSWKDPGASGPLNGPTYGFRRLWGFLLSLVVWDLEIFPEGLTQSACAKFVRVVASRRPVACRRNFRVVARDCQSASFFQTSNDPTDQELAEVPRPEDPVRLKIERVPASAGCRWGVPRLPRRRSRSHSLANPFSTRGTVCRRSPGPEPILPVGVFAKTSFTKNKPWGKFCLVALAPKGEPNGRNSRPML